MSNYLNLIQSYPEKMGQRDILLICGFLIGTHPVEPVDPVKGWFQ